MSIDITQFHSVFFEEAQDHINTMERLVSSLGPGRADANTLSAIFRAAHSIKGSSGVFGIDGLTKLAHALETLLDDARNDELEINQTQLDLWLEAIDMLQAILDAYRAQQEPDWSAANLLIEQLELWKKPSEEVPKQPSEDTVDNGIDEDFGFFDVDETLAEPTTSNTDAAAAGDDDDGFGFFGELDEHASVVDEGAFGFFEPAEDVSTSAAGQFADSASKSLSSELSPTPASNQNKSPVGGTETIRVDVAKIDELVNLVGELVITQSMLHRSSYALANPLPEEHDNNLALLERYLRDLKQVSLSLRMMPVGFIFERLPRLVRETAKQLGKRVNLTLTGQATEIDKGMVERLVDPLTHILRNSVDHGIETPEVRRQVGKSEIGRIEVNARQRGSNIYISISDDGAGLDRDKILAKAADQGLTVPSNAPDENIWALIFASGFSTATAVSAVSGRGVGMDVVKQNLEALGGSVQVHSEAGQGSTFELVLPLTLSIVDGMVVACKQQWFVLPLSLIIETMQVAKHHVATLGNQAVIKARGEYWPIAYLGYLMDIDHQPVSLEHALVVLTEINGKRAAIVVDDMVGEQQVVIKSLERHFRTVSGLSGATIMGDGTIAYILDPEALSDIARQTNTSTDKSKLNEPSS